MTSEEMFELHALRARIAQLEAEVDEQVQWVKDLADLQIKAEARIAQLEAALREAGCDHCRHWFDRAALEERT